MIRSVIWHCAVAPRMCSSIYVPGASCAFGPPGISPALIMNRAECSPSRSSSSAPSERVGCL
eukprot:1948418-Alexandrium_andersonii.AAC.1